MPVPCVAPYCWPLLLQRSAYWTQQADAPIATQVEKTDTYFSLRTWLAIYALSGFVALGLEIVLVPHFRCDAEINLIYFQYLAVLFLGRFGYRHYFGFDIFAAQSPSSAQLFAVAGGYRCVCRVVDLGSRACRRSVAVVGIVVAVLCVTDQLPLRV
jgi:hypothetical protein